jgi:hypothetical protein
MQKFDVKTAVVTAIATTAILVGARFAGADTLALNAISNALGYTHEKCDSQEQAPKLEKGQLPVFPADPSNFDSACGPSEGPQNDDALLSSNLSPDGKRMAYVFQNGNGTQTAYTAKFTDTGNFEITGSVTGSTIEVLGWDDIDQMNYRFAMSYNGQQCTYTEESLDAVCP